MKAWGNSGKNCSGRVFEDKRLRKVGLLERIDYRRSELTSWYVHLVGSVDTPFNKAIRNAWGRGACIIEKLESGCL